MGDRGGYSGRRSLSDKARRARTRRNYAVSQVARDCLLEDRTLLTVLATLDTHGLLSIALTSGNDAATISELNPSTLQVSGGMTNYDFPLASVQSIAAAGNDTSNQSVTFTGAVALSGPLSATGVASETVSGGYQVQSANLAASGTIDIAAGATLSSRQIASGGDPLTAHSIGNSGDLTLTAPNIQVGDGARILANADNGFAPADVTLSADDEASLDFVLGMTGFKDAQTSTSIAIGSATIEAKDVNVTTLSSTSKTVNLTQNLNDNRSVVMADITGDGRDDLIVGNYDGPVEIYLNNGTSDPFNGVTPIVLSDSSPTVGLAVADVTGDGRNDLIVANQDAPTLLYINDGSATNPFGGVSPIAIANVNATSVAVGDVNGDGRTDVVIGVMSSDPNHLTPSELFLNTGNATDPFGGAPINIRGADYAKSVALVDLNGDKRLDLVVGQSGFVSGSTTYGEPTRVFLNSGSASNPFSGNPLNVGTTDLTTTAVAVADMNGDHHPDLIVGHDGEPTQLFLNTGSAANPFGGARPQNITAGEPTTSLTVADVNGDGQLDLIVGNSGVPTQLYLNNGSSTAPFNGVSPQDITAQGDDTASVALGDLNGDGHPDLFVGLNGDFPRVYLNNNTATPFSAVTDTLDPESELSYDADESAVLEFNLLVAAIVAEAEADITVDSGATIVGDDDVTLNAQAITNAQDTVIGVFLGGAYADSEPTANVSVESGAAITAGGDVDVEALVQNTVTLSTIVPIDASLGTISFSYEKARSTSTADVAAGATITAEDATIAAENTNTFSNTAKSLGLQAGGSLSAGVAVAISDVQLTATASVHGSVHTFDDTTVNANSTNINNTTGAITAVLDALQNKPLIGSAITGLGSWLADMSLTQGIGDALIVGSGAAPKVGIAAGVALADSVNTANALVGSQGNILAAGNVTISARAEDNIKSFAGGGVSEAELAAAGGGVDDTETNNQANAYIAPGGIVDAALFFHVVADANIPNPIELFGIPFVPPADNTGTNNSNGTDRVTSGYNAGPAASLSLADWLDQIDLYLTTVLTGRLGSIGTTYAQSEGEVGDVGEGGTFGLAGDVDVFTVNNAANAYIGAGAMVNQRIHSPVQNVEVESDTNIETINLAGQASALNVPALFAGAAGAQAGLGGSFEKISYNNAAHAYIDDQAKVSSGGDINVNANTYNYLLNVAQAGAEAETLGVDGSIIFFNLDNDTEGWIDAGATINAGHDVLVTAGNTLTDIVATGGLAVGGDAGVGASGSFNNLSDTTKAFIGTTNDTTAAGSVTAGNDINVQASSSQEIVSVGISGAFSAGVSPPTSTDANGKSDPTAGVPIPASAAQQSAVAGKEFGIGFSGDVGLNFLTETTEAFIAGTGTITAGGAANVNAADTALFVGAAGGVAYGNHVGIGGSAAIDNLSTTTEAFTQDATILAGSIGISANSTATLVAVGAGGSGSAESGSVAGSVNLNSLTSLTEAFLGDGTTATTTAGGVAIDASNSLSTVTVAGVAALSLGTVAVGGAVDVGIYDPTVLAYIGGTAHLTAAGDVNVDASSSESIRSIGATLAAAGRGGVGAAGSGAAQVLTDEVEAYIDGGAVVDTTGSVFIDANDQTDLLVIGGSAAGGLAAGVGISAGVGLVTRTLKAFVGDGADVSADGDGAEFFDPSGGPLTGTGVVIDATASDEQLVFAAGLGGGADAGLAASAVVDTESSDTEAYIGQSATVTTPRSVQVHAEEDTNVINVAGSFAGSANLGIGAAAVADVLSRTVKASIGSSAHVNAGADVIVSAVAPESIIAVAAGLGVSADVAGIAGSAAVFTLDNDTEAFIGGGAAVSAEGSISVSALSDRRLIPTAGAAGLSLDAGIGASDSTLVSTDTTLAYVGSSARITALGSDSLAPVNVLTGQQDASGNEETAPMHGLSVVAVSSLSAIPITAGGAGALIAGVAGAAIVDDLNDTTQAYIGQSTSVNSNNDGAGSLQDVVVLASDRTTIDSGAGVLGVGLGGVGAGADVAVINNNTIAFIDASATVNANDNVRVSASSQEQFVSASGSAGLGGLGIAGATGVYVLRLNTVADIGAGAHIEAIGNVVVAANDDTGLLMVAGDLGVGATVGIGGAVAVPVITKDTLAYVSPNATVDALGQKGATSVNDGQYDVSYGGSAEGAPSISSKLEAATVEAFTENRTATPETESIRGVAIVATSTDHVTTIAASGGGGEAGVNLAGSAFVPSATTDAYIGAGARVNLAAGNSTSGNAGQSVLVASGADDYHLGVGGALSGGASVGISPGAEITLATNRTAAYIDSSAQVAANQDVRVTASQGGAIVSFAGGLSGAGVAAVAGAVSVLSLNDLTLAYIGNSATVDAGGNVLVSARDDSGSSMLDGTAALGFGAVGVGGSVGINLITKDTEAYVAPGAIVNAMARGTTPMTVFRSGVGAVGQFSTTTANGVAVQAESSEGVFTIAVSGAGGFFGGLAGAVTVNIVGATTRAYVGAGALINQDTPGADPSQSVSVAAADSTSLHATDGALAGSDFISLAGALAGGVDVGVIQNQTAAYIDSGAKVNAIDNVDVFSLADKQGDSLTISAGLGAIGIAGSVAVYAIDAGLSSQALSGLDAHNSGNSGTTGAYADSQADAAAITSQLVGYRQMGSDESSGLVQSAVATARSGVQTAAPTNQVSNSIGSAGTSMGTSATIGDSAIVVAGGAVDVEANEDVALQVVAGGGTLGLATVGGSVAVVNVGSLTQAEIDNDSSISAGGNVTIHSSYDLGGLDGGNLVSAYGGNAGLVASLGAQVAIVTDRSAQIAEVGDGARILQANQVTVRADGNRALTASVDGGVGSVGLAAGAAVAQAIEQGGARADLGESAQVGEGGGTVGSLTLIADPITTTDATSFAIAAGIGANTDNVADSENTPNVEASIGANARVLTGGNVAISADSQAFWAHANIFGVQAGGVAVGVSLADADVSPDVSASVGADATVASAGGQVIVNAEQTAADGAVAVGSASGVSAGTGEGANITATAEALVTSFIAAGATVLSPGAVVVETDSANLAEADTSTLSVGVVLNVGAVFANATASGIDNANLAAGAEVGTAAQPVGSLVVRALGTDQSHATVDLSGGGAFSGAGGTATATTEPEINALLLGDLGPGVAAVPAVDASGDVIVQANSTSGAAANTIGASGGIVDVNESQATANLEPWITSSIGAADVLAGGDVDLGAQSNGIVNATANGSGGGLVGIGGAETDVTANPEVAAEVAGDSLLGAGGNVDIASNSQITAQSTATNSTGGFVGVGSGTANVSVDNFNESSVGNGAAIAAQGNFSLTATSSNDAHGEADSSGGGVIPIGQANVTANVLYQTLASVGSSAQISAGGTLLVDSNTATRGDAVGTSTEGPLALGSGSHADVELYMGTKDNSHPAVTQTTIGHGATLAAKDMTVEAVTTFDNTSTASADVPTSVGGDSTSTAVADANETSHVSILTGATITGTHSVDIEAQNNNNADIANASAATHSLAGTAQSNSETVVQSPSSIDDPTFPFLSSQPEMSQVDAAAGATVITPDLLVKALATFLAVEDLADSSGGVFVSHPENYNGVVWADRTIHWNADVVSLAAAADTVLKVNADGSIDPSSTITPTITPTQIIVPDIGGTEGGGTITFVANDLDPQVFSPQETVNQLKGIIDGTKATFYYQLTLSDVTILNASAKELVINNIGALDTLGGQTPNVTIEVNQDDGILDFGPGINFPPLNPFYFNVAYTTAGPTLVDIENTSTVGSPAILLNGAINNPIGTTEIKNASGSILSAGTSAVVTTNILDISAPNGDVGSSRAPLNFDLVQSESSQHVERPIQSSIVAGGSAYLNFTGILRDPDVNSSQTPFTVVTGSVQAGGDIVGTVQESVRQSSSGSASFGIEVYEPYKNLTTFVTTHFRPGTGTGPAESIDPGFATGNSTLIDSTYSFADLTAGGNIELTGVTASTIVSGTAFTPTIGVTGYTNINPGATNTGVIDASTNGDINLTETAGAMRVGVIATSGNVSLFVPGNAPSGNDFLMASGSAIVAGGGFVGIGVADNMNLAVGSLIVAFPPTSGSSSSVFILGDFGKSGAGAGSIISLAGQIFANSAVIDGGDSDDVISLTNVTPGTVTRVVTGGGVNTVNVGSIPPPAPNGGVTDQIQGPLTVVGNGDDTMNVDDTGFAGSQTGTLTASTLTGLGMAPTGIAYSGLDILNVELGQAPDQFNVQSSAVDTISTIITQAAGNTWNVGSLAPTLTGGVLAGIQGPVIIDGGGSNTRLADTLNVDDSGSTLANEIGTLTDSTLTGMGMGGGGVTFHGMAALNMTLGDNGTILNGNITNNLPATTVIQGGPSRTDTFDGDWTNDFNGSLTLESFAEGPSLPDDGVSLSVNGDFRGSLLIDSAASPGEIRDLDVLGSVDAGASITAGAIDILDIGGDLDINLTLPGLAAPLQGVTALGLGLIGGTLPAGITLWARDISALFVGVGSSPGDIPGQEDLAGNVVTAGDLGLLVEVRGSIATTATVTVGGDLTALVVGPGQLSVGQNMAGTIDVQGTLDTARIAGGTPGLFEAGHVGTIGAYGGFGPVVMHVIEAGVDRRVEEAAPGQFYLQPDANDVAGSPYVNIQYLYESAGFSSPQLSATITNNVGSAPDQFDLSTVVLRDGAKFNLARIDSVGASGLRNLAVEGDLVPGVSGTASSFFASDTSPGGVYLPDDDVAGVGIRDHAPDHSIVAAGIQGVAFGSFTNTQGQVEPGSSATNSDAANLLGPGTKIVPAGSVSGAGTETFRVPFAALPGQQVAFFLDTALSGGAFDPNDMVFTLQSNSDGVHAPTVYPATRGAVTAMISVTATPGGSAVQTVDLYGDGGSIFSDQFIAQSITSTGPLGDLTSLAPQGLNNVTAPSIFGNIAAAGPIFGTIQTTGVRTDPVTGSTSQIPADLGRAYVVQTSGRSPQKYVTTTTIQGQGQDSLTGQIISRGNLISSIRSDGGATGLIAAEGDFGAVTTLLGTPTRVGGLLVNGGFDGQLVVLGNDYGDLTFHGGLTGGRIAVEGTGGAQSGILGNVIVDRGIYKTGMIGAGSAIVSGGEIGDASYGTSLTVQDGNQGIVAAIGTIRVASGSNLGGYVFNDAGGTSNAAAIDAIFTDGGLPLEFDLPGDPLGGLELILQDLAALYVDSNGKLAGPRP